MLLMLRTNIHTQLLLMCGFPVYRYLGTENGFFKIFPGTMLSDIHYDPRDDIWYRKAAENPDKYVFIDMETPKQNSSTYVTMAKVFYQTRYYFCEFLKN